MNRPPFGARLLLRVLLPPHLHEVVAGDLEEQWHDERRRPVAFWVAALKSIYDCWNGRLRSQRHLEPTARGDGIMRGILLDARYAARAMRRNPAFTAAAVLTLGIGIGATAVIFSLLNVLSFKPLPYHDPHRVAFVFGRETETGDRRFSLPLADFYDLRREVTSFEALSAYSYLSANLTGGDIPERVQAYRVTPNTFELLGVSPLLGRTFSASDTHNPRIAVISHGLWTRRFGAEPGAVGRSILLNGDAYDIVGVMPRAFDYPVFNFKGDIWVPWMLDASAVTRPGRGSGTLVARIRSDVSLASAESELQTIMRRLASDYPETNGKLSATLLEMGRLDDEQAGPTGTIMAAAAAALWLLACANVANLLLARGVSRSRELAVRAAVGASTGRIVRQLLVESLLLATFGGALGAALAHAGLGMLKGALPEILLTTMPNIDTLGVDGATLAFTGVATVAASVIIGMLPALGVRRMKHYTGMKEGAPASGGRATRRLRTVLAVAEVALATILVITATLLVRGYGRLLAVDPGFTSEGVLTMALSLPEDRYDTAERRRLFYGHAIERIERLDGIASAAFVNVLPFSTYDRGMQFVVDGAPTPARGEEPHTALRISTDRYFETLEIPVHAGRTFDRRDTDSSQPVAVVNQTFVKRFLGDGPAPGRRIRFGTGSDTPWITIVGTVGDVHHANLTEPPAPEVYVPLSQAAGTTMMMLAARVERGRPEDYIAAVREEIMHVDPRQPVYHVKSMRRLLEDSVLPRTLATTIMGVFSVVALILALIGVYGVVSYAVSQQMAEFGIRLAMGATPAALILLVLRRSALMMSTGLVIGLMGAGAVSSLIGSLLFGVSRLDAETYVGTAAALALIGVAACLIPAWRAGSADAVSALRAE